MVLVWKAGSFYTSHFDLCFMYGPSFNLFNANMYNGDLNTYWYSDHRLLYGPGHLKTNHLNTGQSSLEWLK
jgi:hypothetical protein